ncbi:MAG: hypothetical protein HYV93_25290 [Candidatus Rokubacteria bacterium]|nr:hypothetical protein [Candidatus Rokubacteria bacterium]
MATSAGEALLPMFQDAVEMLARARAGFNRHDVAGLETAAALGRSIHKREKELTQEFLAAPPEPEPLRFVPGHLERMGDAIEGVLRCVRTIEAEGMVFTDRGVREINQLFDRAAELVECARDLTRTGNPVLGRHVEIESLRFQDIASDSARAHEERLIEGVCMPRASSAYLAILDYLREVARHARHIAARVGQGGARERGSARLR